MGIGFEASGFVASGGEAGCSPVCCAKAGNTIRNAVRVPTSERLCKIDKRLIIQSSCSSVCYLRRPIGNRFSINHASRSALGSQCSGAATRHNRLTASDNFCPDNIENYPLCQFQSILL